MNFTQIIEHKKLGMALTDAEIAQFADGAATGSIPDYQLAAMLMAIRLNGMNDEEATSLMRHMRDSGDTIDLSSIGAVTVDKHSTGGVSDATSLVIAPLVAACGGHVPMVSGRGLGHTGGTLDKLESIPGFSVELTEDEFLRQVRETGAAIIGQSRDIAPADKKMYALRDVTSTVDSLPLIVGSILSKKLASGTDTLIMDVKTGSGAVIEKFEDSLALAEAMVKCCNLDGVRAKAVVTDMNQPLGTSIGNALEIEYVIRVLKGKEPGDFTDLCIYLSGLMLIQAGIAQNMDEARDMLQTALESGAALEKFRQLIIAQGGNPAVCDDSSILPHAPYIREVKAGVSGYLSQVNTHAVGLAVNAMGGGRNKAGDPIDPAVGVTMPVRIGDKITPDTTLFTIYAQNEAQADRAEADIRAALTILDFFAGRPKLIYALIDEECNVRLFDDYNF